MLKVEMQNNMIGCVIQARMSSTRLPGKVMMEIKDHKPVLYFVIKQLQHCKLMNKIVVATTILPEDNKIIDFCNKYKIESFRGNQNDVLDRYYKCAKQFALSTIVRITSDCPLIDPYIVDKGIKIFNSNLYDCVSTNYFRTFPDGIGVEVFSFKILETMWKNAALPSEREHVTPYLYNHSDKFHIYSLEHSTNISHLRFTIDRINDLKLIQKIVQKIKKEPILLNNILEVIKKEPTLLEINKDYIPNEGYLKSLKDDEKFLKSKGFNK